ncbi:hypothetical protein [Phaeodactylibacter xiamenensis]|uniref:hypothetical protein n=1 Tax=Phaeodactylibacter xiamenensis TaxID=1524460 RepID=UPI003BA87EB4
MRPPPGRPTDRQRSPQGTAPADPARKTPRPALLAPSHRPGRPRPEDQPSPPGRRPSTVGPGSHRPALNLNLAETSPKTNLNLPQEKPGTAPPRLRLRLRLRLSTSLRHPRARPLCDRLLTTHRPATLAPRPRPGRPSSEDAAWSPALQRLGKIAGRRRPRSDVDTLFEPKRPIT